MNHLLQKCNGESQYVGEDFSVAADETAEPFLAWRLRSGYQCGFGVGILYMGVDLGSAKAVGEYVLQSSSLGSPSAWRFAAKPSSKASVGTLPELWQDCLGAGWLNR